MEFLEIAGKGKSYFLHWTHNRGLETLRKRFSNDVIDEGLKILHPCISGYIAQISLDSPQSNYRKMRVNELILEKVNLLLRQNYEIEIVKFLCELSVWQQGVVNEDDKVLLEKMYKETPAAETLISGI